MKHIDNLWNCYKKTIPALAPPVQIAEAKLGFYSGCAALFCLLMGEADDATVTHEQGAAMLEEMSKEVDEFLQELEGGAPVK